MWIVGGLGDKKNGFLEPHFPFSLLDFDFDVDVNGRVAFLCV